MVNEKDKSEHLVRGEQAEEVAVVSYLTQCKTDGEMCFSVRKRRSGSRSTWMLSVRCFHSDGLCDKNRVFRKMKMKANTL